MIRNIIYVFINNMYIYERIPIKMLRSKINNSNIYKYAVNYNVVFVCTYVKPKSKIDLCPTRAIHAV